MFLIDNLRIDFIIYLSPIDKFCIRECTLENTLPGL